MLSPLSRRLAMAPVVDEYLSPEDIAAIEEGTAQADRGELHSQEEVLTQLGITMEEFEAAVPLDEPEH